MRRERHEAFAFGLDGEQRVMERLRRLGVLVTPKADYVGPGRAPEQRSVDEYLTPCDLDCAYRGTSFGLQVKRKSEATYTRMTDSWDHGFEHAHYTMYKRWQAACGIRLALCITEDSGIDGQDGEDLYAWIDDLRTRHQWFDGRHMIYFPRYSLIPVEEFLATVIIPAPTASQARLI